MSNNTNDENTNMFQNQHGIELEGEVNVLSILRYKQRLQNAVFESHINDERALHVADNAKVEYELTHSTHALLQEILDNVRAQRVDINKLRADVNNLQVDVKELRADVKELLALPTRVTAIEADVRSINYKISVTENLGLAKSNQLINEIPFIYGIGPPAGLPPIRSIFDLQNLTEPNVIAYIHGYSNNRMPQTFVGKKRLLARLVGLANFDIILPREE